MTNKKLIAIGAICCQRPEHAHHMRRPFSLRGL